MFPIPNFFFVVCSLCVHGVLNNMERKREEEKLVGKYKMEKKMKGEKKAFNNRGKV